MKSWLKSDLGLIALSFAYMLYLLLIHFFLQENKSFTFLFQILGYAPCAILAFTIFYDQVIRYLNRNHLIIVIGLLMTYGVVAMFQWQMGVPFLSVMQYILLVGPMEELLYRGVIYKGFCQRHSKLIAWGISSVLFAFVHLGQQLFMNGFTGMTLLLNMLNMTFFSFMISGVFIVLMERTGSLWIPGIFHALWDLNLPVAFVTLLATILYLQVHQKMKQKLRW